MTPHTARTAASDAVQPRLRWVGAPAGPWRNAIHILLVTLAYFSAARFGLTLAVVNTSVTAVWPPTGIALAAVLLFGARIWPAIAVGAFLANVTTSASVPISLGITFGNTLEALAGGYLVRRWAGGLDALWTVPGVFRFVLSGGVAASAISATIGVTSLVVGGSAAPGDFATVWLTWWLGDAVGAVIYAPLVVFWLVESRRRWTLARLAEAGLLSAGALLAALLNFGGILPNDPRPPLAFLCFPIVVWAAFRFSQRETVTSVVAMSVIGIWGTLAGYGPFVRASESEPLLFVQAFSAVLGVMGMAVGALAYQHRRLHGELEERVERRTEQLRQSHAQLNAEMVGRRSADEALRMSELRLLEAQAVAHIGSWEWDVARNSVWWSDELCRLYGVSPGFAASFEEFLRRVHPDDRDHAQAVVTRAAADGQPFAFEHRIVRPDGSVLTLAARGRVVLDEAGRPARMLGTGQDISERKLAEAARIELEKEQRARQRAEEAGRMKDQLLAMVSHELRTPLHAVVGWADVIAADVSNPAQVTRGLEVIKRNAQIQARLVNDLLGASEAALGQLRLEARPVDLRAVIHAAMEAVELSAVAKGISVSAHVAEEATVNGDASRLQQVVWNLLANAIKFTPEGGRVEVALEPADAYVTITVTDSGHGIDPELLAHIFEPFRQGVGGRHQGGLGLGLSIVRTLVEAHGGRVEAESEGAGRGATFRVRLPRLLSPDSTAA